MRLIAKVIEILGQCPVYTVGDKITIDKGYILNVRESDNICMHSLASILPYYIALSRGIKPKSLGLARDDKDKAYLQCPDPCKYTKGGTVIFEIVRV